MAFIIIISFIFFFCSFLLSIDPSWCPFPAISREDPEDSNNHLQHNHHHHHLHRSGHGNNQSNKIPFNGYNSEEYLDRLEPNGNIPANKSDLGYGKRKLCVFCLYVPLHPRHSLLVLVSKHTSYVSAFNCFVISWKTCFPRPPAPRSHQFLNYPPTLCCRVLFVFCPRICRVIEKNETNFNEFAYSRTTSGSYYLYLFIKNGKWNESRFDDKETPLFVRSPGYLSRKLHNDKEIIIRNANIL